MGLLDGTTQNHVALSDNNVDAETSRCRISVVNSLRIQKVKKIIPAFAPASGAFYKDVLLKLPDNFAEVRGLDWVYFVVMSIMALMWAVYVWHRDLPELTVDEVKQLRQTGRIQHRNVGEEVEQQV